MIRIISGIHKGRRIAAPKNLPVRPTTDRAKEALFNILSNEFDLSDIRVLDLFAGTGNISYECASRGCKDITAVDAHPACVAFIKKTALELDMPIVALRARAEKFLQRSKAHYDLIFADPPYNMPVEELEQLVEAAGDQCLMIIEHAKEINLQHLNGFREERRYGGTAFSFLEL